MKNTKSLISFITSVIYLALAQLAFGASCDKDIVNQDLIRIKTG